MDRRIYNAIAAAVFAVICLTPAASKAAPILDISVETGGLATGSVAYAGGATSAAGSGIDVEFVTGLNTPANTLAAFYIDEGFLSFSTGNFVKFDTLSSTWFFGPGGVISATGQIPELGITNVMTLLQGSLGAVRVTKSGTGFTATSDSVIDMKTSLLAAGFGLLGGLNPGDPVWRGTLNISFDGSGTAGGAFASTQILGGHLLNTAAVPEPGTLALLAFGLVGLASFRRKM